MLLFLLRKEKEVSLSFSAPKFPSGLSRKFFCLFCTAAETTDLLSDMESKQRAPLLYLTSLSIRYYKPDVDAENPSLGRSEVSLARAGGFAGKELSGLGGRTSPVREMFHICLTSVQANTFFHRAP